MKNLHALFLSLAFISCHVAASSIDESEPNFDYVEFINDTFDITMSQSNFLGDYSGDYIYTLNGTYSFNDTWRVYGSIDTDKYGDLGLGYSFFLLDAVYNEAYVSVGGNMDDTNVYATGLFSALKRGDFIFFSNFELQYVDQNINANLESIDLTVNHRFERGSFNKLVGLSFEANKWINLMASYGHDKRHYSKRHLKSLDKQIRINDKPIESYVNLGFTLNLWGVKPYISHHFDLKNRMQNYWDFSLSFEF